MTVPKIAIFYDWLNQWGGAEKVLLDILTIYPEATLFTLVHDSNKCRWIPHCTRIVPSIINQLPFSKYNPILYTIFYDHALEKFDFSKYNIVISTTSTIGHCLLTQPQTLFVCYYHNINRYLYQTPTQYQFLYPFLKQYQKIDSIYSKRPGYILCNSKTVQNRIKYYYQRSSTVINPGVDVDFFKPKTTPSPQIPYYLIVSRLVPHKNIDLVIKLFNQLPYKLVIIGTGRQFSYLKKLSNSQNIVFTGQINNNQLLSYYQNCQALICPQIEDFGLVPLEVQACGKPVLAFNQGGITETVINHQTGVFFDELTPESLHKALKKLSECQIKSSDCRKNAKKFSRQSFMLHFKQTIDSLWEKHLTTIS